MHFQLSVANNFFLALDKYLIRLSSSYQKPILSAQLIYFYLVVKFVPLSLQKALIRFEIKLKEEHKKYLYGFKYWNNVD